MAATISPIARQDRHRKSSLRAIWDYARANWALFLLAAPGVVLVFLLRYIPMFGIIVAFEDYRPQTGFFSEWVGLRNFDLLFNSPTALRLVRNTVFLNLLFLVITLIASVGAALLLNELRVRWFKRISQSLMFLPFFVSWTVVAMIVEGLFHEQFGVLMPIIEGVLGESVNVFAMAEWWPWILALLRVWKGTGSGCIVYLAVLTNINPELYEAAAMDGANRVQRLRFISLPLLVPTVVLMTLLAIGRIFYGDFGMIYNILGTRPMLYSTTDVIDTYLIRALQSNANFGLSTAMGLIQAVLGFLFVFGSNWAVRRYSEKRGEDYALF